ncbi:MAG: PIG-L family deacetylase [Bacteroidaceae bacterium]|nr:PIG-L family deacetylase [Bacteroidaceae bacterium]
MLGMEKIVIVSVHPDDETLGCGGTILKHLEKGDEVHCILVTKGNEEQAKIWERVKSAYNFTSVVELGFPELELMDISLNDLIPPISMAINKIKPQVLIIPNRSDAHSDHKAVFNAVASCTKAFRYPFIEKVLMMEVISETDFALPLPEGQFIANYYVDITNQFKRKQEILTIYEGELLPYPQTRNLNTMQALNRYRGSQINAEYAEAFMNLKTIVR